MAKPPAWTRTKIVCTLGPATDAPGVLEALARAGMGVARVNLSHGEHAEHARRIGEVRETARRLGEPIAVLADLPGPKFRLGDLPQGGVEPVSFLHGLAIVAVGVTLLVLLELEKAARRRLWP